VASKPDVLVRVPLLGDFDGGDLQRFFDATHVESFSRGEEIFAVGDPGSSLYILAGGNVQMVLESTKIR